MSAPPSSLSLIKYVVSALSYTFDWYLYRTIHNASVSIEAKIQSIVNVQLCAYTNHANTLCVFTVHC